MREGFITLFYFFIYRPEKLYYFIERSFNFIFFIERSRSLIRVCRKSERKNVNCWAHAQKRHGAARAPGSDVTKAEKRL